MLLTLLLYYSTKKLYFTTLLVDYKITLLYYSITRLQKYSTLSLDYKLLYYTIILIHADAHGDWAGLELLH